MEHLTVAKSITAPALVVQLFVVSSTVYITPSKHEVGWVSGGDV
jgi:hypothetical protein